MADALDILNNLKAFTITNIAQQNIKESEGVIADLQATQLSRGEDPSGGRIDRLHKSYPYDVYHEMTESYKLTEGVGLGSVTDRVTLFDKGPHYEKLYAELKGDEIEYGSHDWKSAELEEDYGQIYGLNTDSKEELVEGVLKGKFQKEFTSLTGLKFD